MFFIFINRLNQTIGKQKINIFILGIIKILNDYQENKEF